LDTEKRNGVQPPQRKKKTSLISTPATLEKERLRGGVGGLGRGTNPLDSFFPFDPYLLRRSYSFIEPFYKHWDGGASADLYVPDDDVEDDTAIIVDGDSEDESTQQIHDNDLNDDGSISESDDDEDGTVEETNDVVRRKRLMSFASNATSVSSRPSSLDDRHDDLLTTKRIETKKAWSTIIKRPRAPSCSENGSW
jgi:RNA polymerase I-specific transcription initiation factor RRN3